MTPSRRNQNSETRIASPEENIGVRLCIEAALGRNIDNTGT